MNLENIINQGGAVMVIILVLNFIGWTIMIWKGISIQLFKRRIKNEKAHFKTYIANYNNGVIQLSESEKLDISLSHYMTPFYMGMNTIRIIASISPLLGLLGTVWGILNSFSIIAQKGLDNPSLFAEGISMALVTTVGGLVVAIPHFVGHNYLKAALMNSEKHLEKQLVCKEHHEK